MTQQTVEKECVSLQYKSCISDLNLSELLIRRWMVAGCFQGDIDDEFLPLDRVNPNGRFETGGGCVCWKDATIAKGSGVMFIKPADYTLACEGVVYFATYIYSRKDHRCLFITDYSGGAYNVVQNGDTLFRVASGADEPCVNELTLRHGWNLLVIKAQCCAAASFYAGICLADGSAFKDGWVKSGFMEGDDIDTQLFGKNPDDKEQAIEIGYIEDEYLRTRPDSIVYIPKEGDDFNDGDNEHFLVIKAPKSDELLAMWTQGAMEPSGDNHIMLARSGDGVHWSQPMWITGTRKGTKQTQASWGFPVAASKTGRIYCFYCESPAGKLGGASGVMGCHISDDNGISWQYKGSILFPDCFDDINDISTQIGGIIVWQLPIRDSKNKQMVGYSLCSKQYPWGCCRFMRFDNIDEGPDFKDIKITWLSLEGDTISMPEDLPNRHCSEPAIAMLPDKRMFMVFRTVTGHVWYSVSENDGKNWRTPQTLLTCDNGQPVKNPLTCCPLYTLNDGRYMLIHYNNSFYADIMKAGKPLPAGMSMFTHRRPAVYSIGRFAPDAVQPLRFDEPVKLLDTDGVIVSPKASNEVATYPSLTYYNQRYTLWYPDRKYFLLGKHLYI